MKTKCPKCQSDEIIQIIYGYPTSEAGEDAEKGFVRLGGCDINEDSPQWHCKNCGHDFRQRRAEGPLVVDQVDPVLGFGAADLRRSGFVTK